MDIDLPASLKRSSSAPMINELTTAMTTASSSTTPTRSEAVPFNIFSSNEPRTRRFSASFSPVHSAGSPGPRLTPRVSQLRQEECVDVAGREAAHERDTFSAMHMSQSWEDLRLVPDTETNATPESSECGGSRPEPRRLSAAMPRMLDPLHLSLPASPPVCSSPSPTPLSRHCFSPSMSYWKSSCLSPSPTRKAFATRRSLSPIAMRPSTLGQVKRKFELEDEKLDHYLSPPAKRPSYGGCLLMAHSNRFDTTSSPLPGSLSSVGTPESVSSADSPQGFSFRPVDSPSPGRSMLATIDEPMNEELPAETRQQDQPPPLEQQDS